MDHLEVVLEHLVLREGGLHLVEVLHVPSCSHLYQVELSRPPRSGEHFDHVGPRVQDLLHALLLQEEVQLGGGDGDGGQKDPTQSDHSLQPLEGPLQIRPVLVLAFTQPASPTSFCSLQKG